MAFCAQSTYIPQSPPDGVLLPKARLQASRAAVGAETHQMSAGKLYGLPSMRSGDM